MAYTIVPKSTAYFDTKLYSGNGGTQTITGVSFQPDWTWIKNRNAGEHHVLTDVVRGANKQLRTNGNNVQGTLTTQLTAFTSDGFSVGAGSEVNNGSQTYASWNWKAGTAVSGATTGSGTAKTYTGSVNTTAGFSIINYIGNSGSGHQIPHRLGVTPKMIIVKCLNQAQNWSVYHQGLGSGTPQNYYLKLNASTAETSASNIWYNTAPNATNFTVGDSDNVNGGLNYIAYCFAEKQGYSKFGKYTGNGNANGTFVYTGFKPAYVLAKRINGSYKWLISDNKRNPSNSVKQYLSAEYADTDASGLDLDFLSNGFKLRTTDAQRNASGSPYIYMAFAEEPLVSTNGQPATAR